MNFLSRWKAGHLLAAWVGYWIALILWRLEPAIPIIWRVSRPDGHGSASATFGDGAFHMSVVDGVKTLWKADIGFNAVLLWAAIPPLVLWVLWLTAQRRDLPPSPDQLLATSDSEVSVPESRTAEPHKRSQSR